MKARKTIFVLEEDDSPKNSESTADFESAKDNSSDDGSFSPFAPSSKILQSTNRRTYRSPSLPNNSNSIKPEDIDKIMLGSSSARQRSSSASGQSESKGSREKRPSVSTPKFSDILDSVLNEVESYLYNLSDKVEDEPDNKKS